MRKLVFAAVAVAAFSTVKVLTVAAVYVAAVALVIGAFQVACRDD